MDIGLIFSAAKVASSLAELTGIIDSVDAKIDRLSQADLATALRSLDQASISMHEKDSLLREARSSFNKAIGLERNERKAVAYLGLAICHHYLKDEANYQKTLEEFILEKPHISATQMTMAEAEASNYFGLYFKIMKELLRVHLKYQKALEKLIIEPNFSSLPNVSLFLVLAPQVLTQFYFVFHFVGNQISRLFSRERRILHRMITMFVVVKNHKDIRNFVELQLAVSKYIDKPVKWMVDIETGSL